MIDLRFSYKTRNERNNFKKIIKPLNKFNRAEERYAYIII